MAALAEFERALISERTRAGMAAARERGVPFGRPKALSPDLIDVARCAVHCQQIEVKDVAESLNVSVRTLRRHMPAGKAPNCGSRAHRTSIPLGKDIVCGLCPRCMNKAYRDQDGSRTASV